MDFNKKLQKNKSTAYKSFKKNRNPGINFNNEENNINNSDFSESIGQDLNNLINELEKKNSINEIDISKRLKSLLENCGDNPIPFELKSEIIAFQFSEGRKNKSEQYFIPFWMQKDINGNIILKIPSLDDITAKRLNYWEKRLNESKNPLFKARYAGLIYEFYDSTCNEKVKIDIVRKYIENIIDIVKKRIFKKNIELIKKINRALEISIKYNMVDYTEIIKKTIIDLEKEFINSKLNHLAGFSLEIDKQNKKFNLTDDEKDFLIGSIYDTYFDEIQNKNASFDYFKDYAIILSDYYYNDDNKLKMILGELESLVFNEKSHESIIFFNKLGIMKELYDNYGLKSEANRILVEMENIAPELSNNLNSYSTRIEIPHKELENIFNSLINDNVDLFLLNLANYFILDINRIEKKFREYEENSPIQFFSRILLSNKRMPIAKFNSSDQDMFLNNKISKYLQISCICIDFIFKKIKNDKVINANDIISFINKPFLDKFTIHLIKKGLDFYFRDEYVAAINILIPQIENMFRNLIYSIAGHVSKKNRFTDGFNYETLGNLLQNQIIEDIFGKDLTRYFKVILTEQVGWNIRNEVCHGLADESVYNFTVANRIIHILLIFGLLKIKEK